MEFSPSPQNEFEAWALDLIEREAKAFVRTHHLPWSDADDLLSEGCRAWWEQREQYDPQRGASRKTFLKRVVRHRFADVLKAESADARGGGKAEPSLDRPLAVDSTLTLGEVMPTRDDFQDLPFIIDARKVLDGLTDRQRAIISGRFDGESMVELARRLAVHRDTLYADLEDIRNVFRASGIFDPTDDAASSHRARGGSS